MSTHSDPRQPEFHFDCVFHYVSHMDLAIRFYRDILGFKLISRDVVARFDIDGVLFELVPAPAKAACSLRETRDSACAWKMSSRR